MGRRDEQLALQPIGRIGDRKLWVSREIFHAPKTRGPSAGVKAQMGGKVFHNLSHLWMVTIHALIRWT